VCRVVCTYLDFSIFDSRFCDQLVVLALILVLMLLLRLSDFVDPIQRASSKRLEALGPLLQFFCCVALLGPHEICVVPFVRIVKVEVDVSRLQRFC
jgi:hypothetical protein